MPARLTLAAICLGLAWWTFGRAPNPEAPDRRRPVIVWAAGFLAAWLMLAGEGFVFLFSRLNTRGWLPVVAVGIVGSWFVVRGDRGTPHCRHWAAGAVGLMIASPFLSRLPGVGPATGALEGLVESVTGLRRWAAQKLVDEVLGAAAILLVAALISVAAWRPSAAQPNGGKPKPGASG